MSNVWTIARHTISESIRMKIAMFFIVLLGVLLLGLPFASKGDNSVSGAVQAFIAYAVGMTSFLLSCLTIFLSRTISNDLVDKQIHTLMVKPLGRWQYVFGKWSGIVLLNLMLLTVSGGVVYGMVMALASTPPRDEFDAERLQNQVLQARHASRYITPDFTAQANAEFQDNLEKGKYDGIDDFDPQLEKARLKREALLRWRMVPPGYSKVFEFEDIRCLRDSEKLLHIVYENRVSHFAPDETLKFAWIIGDRDKGAKEYVIPRRDAIDRRHTVAVPTDAVADDGTLRAVFVNRDPWATRSDMQQPNLVTFDGPDAVEALFSVSSFATNLVRAYCLILCRLMFLAAIAVAATTVFSFPVACLVALSVYVVASTRGFTGDALDWFWETPTAAELKAPEDAEPAIRIFAWLRMQLHYVVWPFITKAWRYLFILVYMVIPDFAKFDGLPTLVDGRNVTLVWVLLGFGQLVALQTGAVLLLAWLLFRRREVAQVSV